MIGYTMDDGFAYDSKRFLMWWLFASVFVWPVTIIIGGFAALALGTVLQSIFFDASIYSATPELIGTLGVGCFIGGVIGFSVGLMQRWVLRKCLYWEPYRWLRLSVLGGLVGGVVIALTIILVGDSYYYYNFSFNGEIPMIWMSLIVLGISAGQWLSLRHRISGAWLWLLANGVGGLVWSFMFMRQTGDVDWFMVWLVSTLALGAMTGGTLLWLFQNTPHEPILEDDGIEYYEGKTP